MRPNIAVFGRFTYLLTLIFWGSITALLLKRANAFRRAGLTVIALYPVAYLWDRYTLAVGVFSIELRTGIDILEIPLEEHLFMIVVPSLVIAFHELIHGEPPDDGHFNI